MFETTIMMMMVMMIVIGDRDGDDDSLVSDGPGLGVGVGGGCWSAESRLPRAPETATPNIRQRIHLRGLDCDQRVKIAIRVFRVRIHPRGQS